MKENHQNRTMSLSQEQIMMSESAYAGSSINTLSVFLYGKEAEPSAMADACCRAMNSADVFSAALKKNEDGAWLLCPGEGQPAACSVEAARPLDEAKALIHTLDAQPLDMLHQLWDARVFPVDEGGALLYVRFHHVIIDGFGIKLFAQRVIDSLENREIAVSAFFDREPEAPAEKDLAFWQEYFADTDCEPELFSAAANGLEKKTVEYPIPAEAQQSARKIAERSGVTLPYVYAAAYALYLATATCKPDAVFLMPRLARRAVDMDVIGCFTLLAPVRVRVDPEDSFDELCRKTAAASRAASAHKETGYANVMRVMRDEQIISSVPSEYVFNWLGASTDVGMAMRISAGGAMHNHLTANFSMRDGEIGCELDLRNGIYDEQRGAFFVDSISGILTAGAADTPVGKIEIVGEAEKALLRTVRGEEYPVAEDLTIPAMLRNVAAKYPDRPALYAGEVAYSFRELDEVSDTIARNLVARGVHSGDRVAFMLHRNFALIPTMLGISKAGGVFIPVDPEYPVDRVNYILENSDAVTLVSAKDVAQARGREFMDVSDLMTPAAQVSLPEIRQGDLAYMIYTSGTTGRPKGVMLTHRGIANIVDPRNNPFNKDAAKTGKGIVAIGSICFDISLFEIFVPMFNGLFVELGSEKAMVDAKVLAEHILRHGANMLHCTPSRIAAYLNDAAFCEALKQVEMILAAGEVLPSGLVCTLRDQYGIRIYNGYGPTETTIGATITEAGDAESIGRPIGNTEMLLLTKDGRQVPYGAVGELCVAGKGVGVGYRGREKETKERFITWNGKPMYRTGDRGYFFPDGRTRYRGRNDRQIKLRGLRIELSEIESVMMAYPGMKQVVAMVRKDGGSEHLVGFFVVDSEEDDLAVRLRKHMASRLTSYMVPDVLMQLPAMPQTPGGKVDTRALEQIEITFQHEYIAPATEEEAAVCRAFETVLKRENVGVQDNFFELGGDSLMVAELMIAIEQNFANKKIEIEFQDVYSCPTPMSLAEKLTSGRKESAGYPIADLDYSGFERILNHPKAETPAKKKPGVILLTGVTGYLGVHILLDFLRRPDSFEKLICLARPKGKLSAERRVKNNLFYYGEDDFSELYGKKWFVCNGDITVPGLTEDPLPEKIDTIINAAANVAHFAYDDAIEKVNIGGIRNVIEVSLAHDAEMCQVSTISVAGVYKHGEKLPVCTEQKLFLGQEIHNQYIYSKYMAEYQMIRAAADRKLRFKVMRVGNLQGRSKDGEFQMNMKTNNFTRQLSSYARLGAVPQSVYDAKVNFSPVDEVAHMIAVLSEVEETWNVYHVYPSEEVPFENIFAALEKEGHHIEVLADDRFAALMEEVKADPERREVVEGLLAERPDGRYRDTAMSLEYTDRILDALGEHWLPPTQKYLDKYVTALSGLDLFE